MTLFYICLPLLLHFLAWRWVRDRPIVPTALAAVVSLAAVLWTVRQSPAWPEGYRIAWLGATTPLNQPLMLGGELERMTCAWPNEARSPAVTLTPRSPSGATLNVDGGSAFLFVRPDGGRGPAVSVNGLKLATQTDHVFTHPQTAQRYRVRLEPAPWWRLWTRYILTVQAEGASAPLARAPVREPSSSGKVTTLGVLLDGRVVHRRGSMEELVALRTWASGIRLFVPGDASEPMRLLEPDAARTKDISLPCELLARWPGSPPVRIGLHADAEKLTCDFIRPWRWTSPLTPVGADGKRAAVTFCAQALPDDHAFLLPLGAGHMSLRIERELRTNSEGQLALLDPQAGMAPSRIPEYVFAPRERWSNDQSIVSPPLVIPAGLQSFKTGIIFDLPGSWGLIGAALPALLVFVLGLWLVEKRATVVCESRAGACGLALTVWVFLCVRLLLALRYAMEPAHIDRLAVDGVVGSYLALAMAPGLVLLFARLAFLNVERIPENRAERRQVLYFALAWVTGIGVTWWIARDLWPAWSEGNGALKFAAAIFGAAVVGGVLSAMLDHHHSSDGGLRRWLADRCWTISEGITNLWSRFIAGEQSWLAMVVIGFVGMMVYVAGCWLVWAAFPPAREAVEEIAMPLGLFWLPALFWLTGQAQVAAAADESAGDAPAWRRWLVGPACEPLRWPRLAVLGAIFVILPILLQVVASGDAGTAFAALAVFIPLACLLSLARPRHLGWTVGLSVAALLFSVWIAASTFPAVFDRFGGEGSVRVRSFLNPGQLQLDYLFGVGMPVTADAEGLKSGRMLNVERHTWENKAFAHKGQWVGLGFARAPVRESQVPLHTAQCDSVFSFYLFSEHGLLGSMVLLAACCVPLFHILAAAGPRLDAGCGLGLLVAGAFLIEMLTQAAMNLGYLPFTGRNLPLLAVLSPTDVAKWTLLFAVAARALYLRYDRAGHFAEAALPLSAPGAYESVAQPHPWSRGLVGAGLPAALLVLLTIGGVYRITDETLGGKFAWDNLKDLAKELQQSGYLKVNPGTHQIEFVKAPPGKRPLVRDEDRLLDQEVERFNQLPPEERSQEYGLSEFKRRLAAAPTLKSYDSTLNQLRVRPAVGTGAMRPPFFEIRFDADPYDEKGRQIPQPHPFPATFEGETGHWEIEVSEAFLPEDKLGDDELGADARAWPRIAWEGSPHNQMLLGPAWIMGRRQVVYDPTAPLSWVAQLAAAMRQETEILGPAPATGAQPPRLTLAPLLHRAAMDFATNRGRTRHAQLMVDAAGSPSDPARELRQRIPPRVALTVLDLAPARRGQILALGGWPRTTSRRHWEQTRDGEILPPAPWTERNAPERLKRRYLGDRNFDLMPMGSASKPLFAAAALGVHPFLQTQLHTEGGAKEVGELFGQKISSAEWDESWHGGPGPWRNFIDYMAWSDNRYHLRLNFLALADAAGGSIAGAGRLGSSVVSLDPRPPHDRWMQFPKFPAVIEFRENLPRRFDALDRTPFAQTLHALFPLEITKGQLRATRRSLWSRRAADDLSAGKADWSPWDFISPQPAKLDFDQVKNPRDYVTLLLGGGNNLWSNVDFAGAFGSLVIGAPVLPHLVEAGTPVAAPARDGLRAASRGLNPGLKKVVSHGTAASRFAMRGGVLQRWTDRGCELYAKTGTLDEQDGPYNTSRLVLALVRWKPGGQEIEAGLVFSLVAEHAATGTATEWLRDFLNAHDKLIERFLTKTD